jgi:hypothetical protein
MAAPQHTGPAEPGSKQHRWTEPDAAKVAKQIDAFQALPKREFARELAAFIAAEEKDRVAAYSLRSPELARKARRLIPEIVADPDQYLDAPPGESNNRHRERIRLFRARAEHEGEVLYNVVAGMIARRGHLPPESNPRARARRRLADEFPERYLELVREEQKKDEVAAEERRRMRAERKAAEGS